MAFITIHAKAPWGPVSLRTAADLDGLRVWGERPAATVDVGECDPAAVVREALRLLPAVDRVGQIATTVEKSRKSVAEAVSRVSAMVVADDPNKAVPGPSENPGGAVASDEAAECNITTANDSMPARSRRRLGAEVNVREIRAGLGMSQPVFAAAFGLKLAVLRDWEQGRTKPDGGGAGAASGDRGEPRCGAGSGIGRYGNARSVSHGRVSV